MRKVGGSALDTVVDVAAALALPEEALAKPILVVFLPGRDGDQYALLIDGHHRLFNAYRNGRELTGYVVSDAAAIKKFYGHNPRVKSLFSPQRQKKTVTGSGARRKTA